MATQIQATPVIRGEEALKVMKESQTRPTEASRRGAQILRDKFAPMVRKDNR